MRNEALQLWGGAECTICRVGNEWRDQSSETGHRFRLTDLDRIASLGVKAIRLPLLWEAAAPTIGDRYDLRWAKEQVERAEALGLEIIAGLMHHGSGPLGTSLLDPEFPDHLAQYAGAVAREFPGITRWTPINEPLTTARFSTLYGHWYPHHRDQRSFARAVVNQCLATARSMRAIRVSIPGAELVQTEDIGKTFASPSLERQADFENQRRWLGLDLLTGRVTAGHAWRDRLIAAGIHPDELDELALGDACPALIGVNYYLTSERFLDSDIDAYDELSVGGNGRDRYVDSEAIRHRALVGEVGSKCRLREVWERYGLPMAVTEVHHGCTRDEQLRWFNQIWTDVTQLREEGVDVCAVTLWSIFGAIDWRSLLTRREGSYDAGAFDARCDPPRPTVVAAAAKAFSAGRSFDHPALDAPGWWQRESRFYGPDADCPAESIGRPLLILGASGTLGRAFAEICRRRGLAFRLTGRGEVDLDQPASIDRVLDHYQPWAIINTTGFVRVDDAEQLPDACFAANSHGVRSLAAIAARAGVRVVGFSTDLVFDGKRGQYDESDACNPTGVYGRSKAAGEYHLLAASVSNLVVRTSAFFGPWDAYNFAYLTGRALRRLEPVTAAADVFVSPTYVPDLCHAVLDMLIDGESGLWHIANHGRLSWFDFAHRVAAELNIANPAILATAARPSDTSLISSRGPLLRDVHSAIADCERHRLPHLVDA